MADKTKQTASGAGGGDTSFRKTFDRKEASERARANDAKAREEAKARSDAAAQGKKYHKRIEAPTDLVNLEARQSRLKFEGMVGRTTLVPAGAAVGKRGIGAGFVCLDCEMTYKSNTEYLEHLNSQQHAATVGISLNVEVATVDQVRHRLRWLAQQKRDESKDVVVDLDARLELSKEMEEKEREEKRRRRNEKRRKGKNGDKHVDVKMEYDDIQNDGVIS